MKVLVTGGAGFIGSNIVRRLIELGHEVLVYDNFATGRRENLTSLEQKITLIKNDILDQEFLESAMRGVELVFHQAAIPSVARSIESPTLSFKVNSLGTLHVLEAARNTGVRRVIYAASSSAYGNREGYEKAEHLSPQPLSPYSAAKLSGEHLMKSFAHVFGIQTVCLRYFNVFGPRQDPHSSYGAALPLFIKAILRGESPIIHGDGLQSRDFTYVDNVVEANILATKSELVGKGESINIALGSSINLLDITRAINKYLGTNIQPNFIESRAGDVRHSRASIVKAKELLGYEPVVSFDDGLNRTIEYYRQELNL